MYSDIADAVAPRAPLAGLVGIAFARTPDESLHLLLAQIARDNPGCEIEETSRFLIESGRHLTCDLAPPAGAIQ
jgi:hypothetical protein